MKTNIQSDPTSAPATPRVSSRMRGRSGFALAAAILLLAAAGHQISERISTGATAAAPAAKAVTTSVTPTPAPRRETLASTDFTPRTNQMVPSESAQREACFRWLAEIDSQRAALIRAQDASEVARTKALRMQDEMQVRAEAAARSRAQRVERDYQQHTAGYLDSLGL